MPGNASFRPSRRRTSARTHRHAQAASLPSSLRSKRACSRSRFGMVNTTCRCATGKQTSSATCRAVSNARFWWQRRARARCLQEKATNISCRQSGQRTRAKPSCRSPHLRNAVTDRSTIGRQKPYLAAKPLVVDLPEGLEMPLDHLPQVRTPADRVGGRGAAARRRAAPCGEGQPRASGA